MAAPMRLASWIRFETLMLREDWAGAISMLVSDIHRPDQELLQLLRACVPDQVITSMEEASSRYLAPAKALTNWQGSLSLLCLAPKSQNPAETPPSG